MLVGGIAMLQYVEGRNTQDIDLIVGVDAVEKLPEVQVFERQQDFARARFEGVRLDFLFTTHPLFDLVRKEYSSMQAFEQGQIRCATVEGMVLLKLYALPSLYRQGRFARVGLYENDVATLLQEYKIETAKLMDILSKQLSGTDLALIRKILAELAERIQRFEDKANGSK